MALGYIRTAEAVNAAYTRLLYTISGSVYTDQPQYQYVLDVYETGGDLLKRMTQPVNPAGTATFDVSRVVQGELSIDYNWKINSLTAFNSSSKQFNIKAGEQFGTSISSSVTVYPDQDNVGLLSWQGVIEPNAGNYNWSYIVDSQVLSNMPATMSMQSDDYGTISVYNDQGTFISQSFYSASDTTGGYELVDQKNYSTSGTYLNAVPISSSADYWNYVDVSISSSFGTETYRYEASDETHREKTRFAFVNKLGAWDYYNNYNPVRQRINVTRQEYTAPRVDYSSRVSTYDISRRGKTVNDSTTDDQFTVDTDYLDKTTANWLEELIESPEVYIQRNGEFIPVLITDTNYTAKTSAGRQKLFKYTINFKPSNQPFGTWIPEYVQCPKQPFIPIQAVTNAPTNVTAFEFTMNGSGTNGTNTIAERGFVLSKTDATPEIGETDVIKFVTGSGAGTFDYFLSGSNYLSSSQNYYYRAYTSASGELVYGTTEQFDTLNVVPSVSTLSVDSVTDRSFIISGSITDDGGTSITEKGFAYSSQSTTPLVSDITSSVALSGSNIGTYSTKITSLNSDVIYYARAYAKNNIGVSYGNVFTASMQERQFSPSLDGELSLNHWWDYTDSGSMILSGSNYIQYIYDKGDLETDATSSMENTNTLLGPGIQFTSLYSGSSVYPGAGVTQTELVDGNVPRTLVDVNNLTYTAILTFNSGSIPISQSIDFIQVERDGEIPRELWVASYTDIADPDNIQGPYEPAKKGTLVPTGSGTMWVGSKCLGSPPPDFTDGTYNFYSGSVRGTEHFHLMATEPQNEFDTGRLVTQVDRSDRLKNNYPIGRLGDQDIGIRITGWTGRYWNIKHLMVYQGVITEAQGKAIYDEWQLYKQSL